MQARVIPGPRAGRRLGLLLAALGLLLAGCDIGGGSAPAGTATPVTAGPTVTVPADAGVTGVAGTPPVGTDTPAPPAPTVLPTLTPIAAPTALRNGNTTPGISWQLMGLTGQELFMVAGSGQVNAPVYVGGTGVYRSADQGATWRQLGFDIRTQVEELEVAPANPQVIYAGSGAGCYGGPAGGQFRSSDGGATWKPLKQAPSSLQVDVKDANRLTAITCTGVVRSTDGGATWTPLADAGLAALKNYTGDRVRVAGSNPQVIYAAYIGEGGNGRVRVSTDGGATWGGDASDVAGLSDLLVDDGRPARAWVAAQAGVLRTSDSGQSWLATVTGLDAAHNTAAGSQGAYQLSALAAQYDSNGGLVELYVGSFGTESQPGAGIFGSRDFGQVWTRFGGDLGGRAIHDLLVTRESGAGAQTVVLYAATDDGVHKIVLGSAK